MNCMTTPYAEYRNIFFEIIEYLLNMNAGTKYKANLVLKSMRRMHHKFFTKANAHVIDENWRIEKIITALEPLPDQPD